MAIKKTHTKPAVPEETMEAEKVARQMYDSLTKARAPRATPAGYVMGACVVLKLLMDQASQQGADRVTLKAYVQEFASKL